MTRLRYSATNTHPFRMTVEEIMGWGESPVHGYYAWVEDRETGNKWRSLEMYETRIAARSEGWRMLDRHVAEREKRDAALAAEREAYRAELAAQPKPAVPRGFLHRAHGRRSR